MTYYSRFAFVCALTLLASACSKEPAVPGMKIGKPYTIDGQAYFPEYDPSYDKVGEASWYGPGFHGKYTASGERFNQEDMTAAHPTLPMPSIVRVTNLANGKAVMVRINDRGPFKSNRIIDLSKAAAMSIGLRSTGKVRVQYLGKETNQYIAQFKDNGNRPVSMEAFIDHSVDKAAQEQIVEANVETTQPGQTVNDAAPVQSVGGKDLPDLSARRVQVSDTGQGAKLTPLVYSEPVSDKPLVDERMIRDETGKPVHLKGASDHDAGFEKVSAPAPQAFRPQPAKAAIKKVEDDAPKKAQLAPSGNGGTFIQVGAFSTEANARKLDGKLSPIGPVVIGKMDAGGKEWWRVRVGPFASNAEASAALDKVHAAGLADARIVH